MPFDFFSDDTGISLPDRDRYTYASGSYEDMAEYFLHVGRVNYRGARWVCTTRPCTNPASPDRRGFRSRASVVEHLRLTHPRSAEALVEMVGVEYPVEYLNEERERRARELTRIYLTPSGAWRKL